MKQFPVVALGDVLRQRKEFITIDDTQQYKRCRVQLHARGVVLRDLVFGSDIKTKKQQVCRASEFLVAEIDAKVGGFGLVPDELDGAVVSSHYFLYEIDRTVLEPRYLDHYCRTERFRAQVEAQGSTNYAAIRPTDVLAYTIPLPPVREQQAIVARLDALAEKTRQVEAHLEAAERDSLRLLVTLATRRDLSDEQRRALGWRPGTIADIAALALDPDPVKTDRSYPNVGILSYARGLFGKVPIDGAATSAKTLYRIRSGQFIYSRLFAFEGAYALVSEEFDGCYVSNEFPTFDVNRDLASSKFLMALFMTEADWQEMRASTKGVGDRRLRIQPDHILARQIWIPPSQELRRIDSMFDQHLALKAKHAAIRQANAALLPATLERIFAT